MPARAYVDLLSMQFIVSPDLSLAGILAKDASVTLLSKLIDVFPKTLTDVFAELVVAALGLMSALRQPFYRVEVKGLDVDGVATSESGYDSQGDEMGLSSLVCAASLASQTITPLIVCKLLMTSLFSLDSDRCCTGFSSPDSAQLQACSMLCNNTYRAVAQCVFGWLIDRQ
jgi:hypothetical protein